ncbi:putative S-adenosyl-L-methionine-dependent methyltransferase protein [Dioscorea alata]|uniref:S-adenosyl-L-methionine-dependent methyltransferase protein n=3 Tax=Dioscorea alata TaxID=55571 RepID=A0ACB7USJ4_DIOAL|nr:putative S-adenosyl-L-methionine-dependent methyltransferase protein [Dioscorea alata]KAH7663699.1 putative S-adenosyl-L-methionine-dependent methyltransferase protein [Dioscorea alata]
MALGKYTRVDNNRRSSSYCSTVAVVVFVALCLIGVWMMTSSSSVSTVDMSSPDTKSESKEQVPQINSKPFEDSSGDVPDDAKRGEDNDADANSSTNVNMVEKNQDENSDDASKSGTFNDANGKVEGGDGTTEGGQSEGEDKKMDKNSDETESDEQNKDNEVKNDEQSQSNDENKSEQDEKPDGEKLQNENDQVQQGKGGQEQDSEAGQSSDDSKSENQGKDQGSNEVFPDGAQSELLNETTTQNEAWATQAAESRNEKAVQSSLSNGQFSWKLCNVTAGADYIPCLDNEKAIKKLPSTKHYEHRERHCPEEGPTCLVPLPEGYKRPIEWPTSRDKIWYSNVPHTKLAVVKGHQNWVKVSGEYLTFPGGGTQFKHGALHYIDFIQEARPDIAWGKRSRVILDVGCGVASFGGYLFDRDVLTMSFAPKDEHEAQVQFALERGIPAISAVMGTKRLPFPGRVFDVVHCARCRVPWHIEGGKLLLELNRLLRPGGYFVWSATPVYQNLTEDVEIWKAMAALMKSMCWEMVAKTKDTLNQVGLAIFKKPSNNECYDKRAENNPPVCGDADDANAAWNIPLQACMHKIPVDTAARGSQWPQEWPSRLEKTPYWLDSTKVGVYGKPAPEDFQADYKHWKRVVSKSYLNGMGINWSAVRNVMDMRSVYGGFAAALRDMKVWVMNIVSIDSPDTLPIIYERGLFGVYHDWCESFSTYPRTYDLLHADHLFSKTKKKCKLAAVIAEVDRLLRPEGKLIVRDDTATISEVENMAKSLHWEIRLTYSKENEGLLCVQKTTWRPSESESNL